MNPEGAQVCVTELCPEHLIVSEVCSAAVFRWILQDRKRSLWASRYTVSCSFDFKMTFVIISSYAPSPDLW